MSQNYPNKRNFSYQSINNFQYIKKRRLNSGVQYIQPIIGSEDTKIPRISSCSQNKHTNYPTTYLNVSNTLYQQFQSQDRQDQNLNRKSEIKKRTKFKARPVPRSLYQPNFTVTRTTKQPTIPEEFNFKCAGQTPTKQVISKQSNQNTPIKTKSTQNRMPTQPQPFQFLTEKRLQQKQKKQTNQSFCFKARPMPDFQNPFMPRQQEFQQTQTYDFQLSTQQRAKEREIFDEQLREKQKREEIIQQQAREQQERMLLEEIRQKQQFKARPMPIFDDYQEAKRPQPHFTIGQYPNLLTEQRATQKKGDQYMTTLSHMSTGVSDVSSFYIEEDLMDLD